MKARDSSATVGAARMVPKVTMRLALSDPRLLADAMVGDLWFGWRTLLIAAAGEKLNDNERQEFLKLTGRPHEPGQMVSQFIAIFGRRAGKSVALATFLVWIACLNDHRGTLKGLGEKGIALAVSRDQRVARVILGYVDGILRNSKLLRGQIVKRTADTIELRNKISIEVRPCSSKTLRGPSYICVASDEVAFWQTATELMNPDVEIISSLMPALMTTGGPLLIASSVYSKVGLLYELVAAFLWSRRTERPYGRLWHQPHHESVAVPGRDRSRARARLRAKFRRIFEPVERRCFGFPL